MDKLVQRTQNAVRNATRKKARRDIEKNLDELWNFRMRQNVNRRMVKKIVKNEQLNRKEDWKLGPRLAPRRDVGEAAEKYATIDQALLHPPEKTTKEQKGFRSHLTQEDRVVILEGRDKGKIGIVSDVNVRAQSVKIRNMNLVDYFIPDFMRIEQQDSRRIAPVALDLPMSDVRLVLALEDSEGNFRDVVVDKVVVKPHSNYDIKHNNADKRGRRYIPGLNKDIPWPPMEEPEHELNDVDTQRIDLDPDTWKPSLMTYPFPPSVLDELRNKYSKFRTRHDPEYIALKEAQAAAGPRTKVLAQMASTPMQELIERNKKERAERQKDLTEEQLATIGEVMARARRLEKMEAAQKKVQGGPQTQTS